MSENVGLNSPLHWIPQAGREGFIVLNRNLSHVDRDDSFVPVSADLAVKFRRHVALLKASRVLRRPWKALRG